MSSNFDSDDPRGQTEVRRRMADRLGYLLARRWIRLHATSGKEEKASPPCEPAPADAEITARGPASCDYGRTCPPIEVIPNRPNT